ncbi:hypothetical protein GE061_019125 [Apolygus lucorum]|uniref:Uncharacterized protein n=1 Tax=Apolygus lucorum TaxID=248454 RepID=A0A8S9X9F7_APOLU|nr:hypothetical protein GE061_019125 [Apolygus lucorum]
MLINLYERIGIDLIHPSYSDSYKHNAFYYAMRSNDVKLVDLLIEKWPRFNLGENIECFEEILSGSYQDLTLRNVALSSEMHLCVESRLLDFRLAINNNSELDENLHTELKNHNIKFPFSSFETELSPEKIETAHAADRTLEIKQLVEVGNCGNKTKHYDLALEERKSTLSILELLMVETFYSMGHTENCGTKCHAFIDARVPILYGSDLVDYLIHKKDIVDICSDNSATSLINNARLIVTGNFEKCLIDKTLFDLNELIERDYQINNVVCFQHQLLQALSDGKMETMNLCLENGSDIFGRTYDNNSALHYAAKGPSSGSLKYILDQWKLEVYQQNNDGMNPLHLAAYNGHAENVKLLLNRVKKSVDTPDKFGWTALHYSVSTKYITVTKMLLMFEADPNSISQEGHTPLKQALYSKNVEASKVILQNTNFCYGDTIGTSPLSVAAENGLLELLPALIKLEAKHSEQRKSSAVTKPPTPLHYAAKKGQIESIKVLLQNGWVLNAETLDGHTPLYCAVLGNKEEVVRFLLNKGADARNADIIFRAAANGNKKIMEMLISAKAPVNTIEAVSGITLLHVVADHNRKDLVELLIKNGIKVNAKDIGGRTALHYCARKGHYKLSKLLMKYGAKNNIGDMSNRPPHLYAVLGKHQNIVELMVTNSNVNDVDCKGLNALHYSCQLGSTGIARYLLGKGAEVNAKTIMGATPLLLALLAGHEDVATLLCKKGASITDAIGRGSTPCHLAAAIGQTKVIKLLLKLGADVNKIDSNGWTPLHRACESGSLDCTTQLIDEGCSVNSPAERGITPLFLSVRSNNINVVKLLVNKGAKFDENALNEAARLGFANIMELLLDRFPNSSNGTQLLSIAVGNLQPEIIKMLVDRGADVNAENREGSKPLHTAAFMGSCEMIQLMLELGADPNAKLSDGVTPLHLAAKVGHRNSVETLLIRQSNILAEDSKGRTPLSIAIRYGHTSIVKLFLNHNKSINLNDFYVTEKRISLLQIASVFGEIEIVKLLVQRGANIDKKDEEGCKAIHYATIGGYADVVKFFLSAGMDIYDSPGNGNNLLHLLSMEGRCNRLSVAKLLVCEKNMDPNRCNDYGRSPLQSALILGDIELIEFFLENGSYFDKKICNEITMSITIRLIFDSVEQLFAGAKRGNILQVLNSIHRGAVVNVRNERNETPLLCSSWKGKTIIVKELLENGANPDLADKSGSTPLHYASKFSHYSIVIALLESGSVFEPFNNAGKTPRDYATDVEISKFLKLIEHTFLMIKSRDIVILDTLQKMKLRPHEVRALINCRNREGKTIMACALLVNFPDVRRLRSVFCNNQNLERAIKSLYLERSGASLTCAKLERHHPKSLLVIEDCMINIELDLVAALSLCGEQEYDEGIFELGKIHEICKKMIGENGGLTIAVESLRAIALMEKGKSKCALKLLENIIERQRSVLSPMHIELIETEMLMSKALCSLGKLDEALKINYELIERFEFIDGNDNQIKFEIEDDIAMILLEKGKLDEALNLHEQVLEKRNMTLGPKHRETLRRELIWSSEDSPSEERIDKFKVFQAISRGDVAVVTKMFENGMDLNSTDAEGRTALHYAVSSGNVSLVERLIDHGANVKVKSKKGNTPLHSAALLGSAEISEILLKRVKVTERRDFVDSKTIKSGMTALHVAASRGKLEVAKILLKYGATFNVNNHEDKIPMDLSINEEVTSILRKLDKVFTTVTATSSYLTECDEDMNAILRASRNADGRSLTAEIVKCKELLDKLV